MKAIAGYLVGVVLLLLVGAACLGVGLLDREMVRAEQQVVAEEYGRAAADVRSGGQVLRAGEPPALGRHRCGQRHPRARSHASLLAGAVRRDGRRTPPIRWRTCPRTTSTFSCLWPTACTATPSRRATDKATTHRGAGRGHQRVPHGAEERRRAPRRVVQLRIPVEASRRDRTGTAQGCRAAARAESAGARGQRADQGGARQVQGVHPSRFSERSSRAKAAAPGKGGADQAQGLRDAGRNRHQHVRVRPAVLPVAARPVRRFCWLSACGASTRRRLGLCGARRRSGCCP